MQHIKIKIFILRSICYIPIPMLTQGECEKCEDLGEIHGPKCIVRNLIFDRDFKRNNLTRKSAMEAAVQALETYIQKERKIMTTHLVTKPESGSMSLAHKFGFTESQLDLIRNKVAKNATHEELEMFFYQCMALELNPLMPGEIYFVKFGTNPGTIIVGIEGFRKTAHSTGKLAGVKRGVIRDKNGICIGGWADVYRTDWKEPAHEEVALQEYNTGKGNWVKMPETMIKKVAEAAAYRMAFPKNLGGIYIREEMDQAEKFVESEIKPQSPQKLISGGEEAACCGRPMMRSKFPDKMTGEYPLYCPTCKSKRYPEKKTDSSESKELKEESPTIEVSENFENYEIQSSAPKKEEPKEEPKPLPWKKYLPEEDPRIVK